MDNHIVDPFNVKFDVEKAMEGMKQIEVSGIPNSDGRMALIEEAISMIQQNPDTAFIDGGIGYKNYAGFGDQRCDCRYGLGPKHGSVVYSIGRTSNGQYKGRLTEDAIYMLQCVRDFGAIENPKSTQYNNERKYLNFRDVLVRVRKLQEEYKRVYSWLSDFEPELVELDSEVQS